MESRPRHFVGAPPASPQPGAARLERQEEVGCGRLHGLEHEARREGGGHALELRHGERLPDAVARAEREAHRQQPLRRAQLALAVEPTLGAPLIGRRDIRQAVEQQEGQMADGAARDSRPVSELDGLERLADGGPRGYRPKAKRLVHARAKVRCRLRRLREREIVA